MITIQWFPWKKIHNNINEMLSHQRNQKKKCTATIIGQGMPTGYNVFKRFLKRESVVMFLRDDGRAEVSAHGEWLCVSTCNCLSWNKGFYTVVSNE